MAIDFDKLQRSINYKFSNLELVRRALTHASASHLNNERLEFLGDSLLGFLAAESLFDSFPDGSEGELTRLRASMVNKSTLAGIASKLDLGEFIQLSPGELKSGGRETESILADTVEAIIAAVYLDGGIGPCKKLVMSWSSSAGSQKDAKTLLQETMQAEGLSLPEYRVVEVTGKPPQQSFLVECEVVNLDKPQQGRGNSKRNAEQEAAKKILTELGELN
ncbi:MAG: ribonuclease III [Pseudohongiellaceae bacterium]